MSEMVERVAKAIAAASLDADELPVSDRLLEVVYFPLARAAIEAMREPTDAMVKAADSCVALGVWEDMIDEGLK